MKTKFYSLLFVLLAALVAGLAVATAVLPYDALLSMIPGPPVSPSPGVPAI